MRGAKKKHVKKGHGLVDFESDTLDQCSAIGLMRKISEKVMGGVGGGAEDRHLTAGDELSTLKVITKPIQVPKSDGRLVGVPLQKVSDPTKNTVPKFFAPKL